MNPDPLRPPETDVERITWLGLEVDERPKSGAILLYAGIALLLFGAVALWLVMGQR